MNSWQNLAIPIVMLLTGIILVVGDGMGILSLDNIRSFWPISLIAVGALELPSARKQRN